MRGVWGTMSVMQKEGHRSRTTGGGTLSAGTEVLRGATRPADFLIYAGGMAYCGGRHGSGHGFFVCQSARGLCHQGSVQQSGPLHGEGAVRQAPWTNKVRKVSSQSAMLEEYVSQAGLRMSEVCSGAGLRTSEVCVRSLMPILNDTKLNVLQLSYKLYVLQV